MKAVQSGELPEKILDEAVRNLLHFVKKTIDLQKNNTGFDRDDAHNLSEQLACECAVLLKNDGTLPLNEKGRLAFIGAFAESPRYQGAGSSHINVKHPVGALECVDTSVLYAKGYDAEKEIPDDVLIEEAVLAAKQADTAVIFAGLPESYETEGCDRDHLGLPENQNALIRAVTGVQKNTVVVLHGGSCMELPWIKDVNAVLLVHLGGDRVGAATVDLLFGRKNPSGKLAETWLIKLSDNPSFLNFPGEEGAVHYAEGIYVGYRYYDKKEMNVLFPFGHGLSYTTFSLGDLRADIEHLTDSGCVAVTVTVTNTGVCAGKEVVQLYAGIKNSAVHRPLRELKGFKKVFLQPGESQDVTFLLDKRSFAYYEPKIHDWFVESGDVEISVGTSSRDLQASLILPMQSQMELPIHYTRYSMFVDLLKTKRGRDFFEKFIGPAQKKEEKSTGDENLDKSMGAGAAKMRQQMMMEMTLNGLYSYGRMSEDQMNALIEQLNAKE